MPAPVALGSVAGLGARVTAATPFRLEPAGRGEAKPAAVRAALPTPSLPRTPVVPSLDASATPTPSRSPASNLPVATPGVALLTPTPTPATESIPAETPTRSPAETMTAEETPPPPPTPDGHADREAYLVLLRQVRQDLDLPSVRAQPEELNNALDRLRNNESSQANDFVKSLPGPVVAATEEPALPADRWKKDPSVLPTAERPGVVYQFPSAGVRMPFNRVTTPNGAFYVSATTVPVQLGRVLAHQAKVTRTGGILGATAWAYDGGNYSLRRAWFDDANNLAAYKGLDGQPEAGSPMNGISAQEAALMAQAAGCSLPTLSQWTALLESPAGQYWKTNWRTVAKVRGPAWEKFAKDLERRIGAGEVVRGDVSMPYDRCFGGTHTSDRVGSDPDSNLFFERVDSRLHEGYCHLIGNVGQYVTDDTRTKYYFAGGSAESDPAYFAGDLARPPVASPIIVFPDGGLRLVVGATKGGTSDQDFAKLSKSVDDELARVQKF